MNILLNFLMVLCLAAICQASPRSENEKSAETKTRKVDRGLDEYMYQTIVTLIYNDTLGHDCKGTIIRPRLIMTAAYCLFGSQPTHVKISTKDKEQESLFEIRMQFPHPDYDLANSVNDIAVLVLNNPIPNARLVSLPNKSWSFATGDDVGLVYGWGGIENGTFFNELRILALPILSQTKCKKYFANDGHFLCVDTQHAYVCKGNAGGPLVWHSYQIGIIPIKAAESCKLKKPLAFTDVTAYEDWLAPHVRKYYG
ncbi:hypothetical protein QAD02_011969 [Eretmocerus hayati]|uniref:Uncharacterized protein n=1 Tax=Eretmocerus hayati TaxID=131215 RepID=A0ACC2NZB2_9HYME|nr:hypothetical protein QAD02_011969 [Eretmocerus hayati]